MRRSFCPTGAASGPLLLLPGPAAMTDPIKSGETFNCEERTRLLAQLEQAIQETILTRNETDASDALKCWRAARRAFMRHIEEHGC